MTKDVETYGDLGRSLVPTGAALARKDYLDAYHAYRREADPDFDEAGGGDAAGECSTFCFG